MEFRRIEVRKLLRHREFITDAEETAKILEALKKWNLRFSMKVASVGPRIEQCAILSISNGSFVVYSGSPKKIQTTVKFTDIEMVEVESNSDFICEEQDNGGRWSRLM
jgi:hypothetical protein